MSYKAPITIMQTVKQTAEELAEQFDGMILKAIYEVVPVVDKDELLRALQYDRGQYDKGFNDGILAAADELVRCKDCKYRDELSKQCACPMAIGWDALAPEDDDFCSRGERRSDD